MIDKSNRARAKNSKKTLKRLLSYFKGYRLKVAIVIFAAIFSAFANVFGTYYLSIVIDTAVAFDNYVDLIYDILLLASIYLLGAASTLFYTRYNIFISQQIIKKIRSDMFKHMQDLPMKYFDNKTHGEIMSYYTNDIDTLNECLNNSIVNIFNSLCMIIGTMVFLLVINIYLALIVYVFIILMLIYMVVNSKICKKYYDKNQYCLAKINSFIEEHIKGIKEEKIFNHQEENLAQFNVHNKNLKEASEKAIYHTQLNTPFIVSLSYLNFAISAVVGVFFAINSLISFGMFSSYLVYVRQSAQPFNLFISHINSILSALAGCERIFEFLDLEKEEDKGNVTLANVNVYKNHIFLSDKYTGHFAWMIPQKNSNKAYKLVLLKGDIRFNNVTFGYNDKKVILNDISLYAKPGQKIAFVGSTGAGKTTIINLITRFYEIQSGEILYDGINIKDISKSSLRRSISMVLQDTHLFNDTILNNVRFSRLKASDEDVIAAIKLVRADRFIEKLKDGYNTILYDDGTNLSQGQRQLLSIARAAVSQKPVLVLDEATSNVDTRTEKLIEKGMDILMENRTVLVIAHRLSTIENAKAILVLEKGKIIERGNKDELLKKKGFYYNLYNKKIELS